MAIHDPVLLRTLSFLCYAGIIYCGYCAYPKEFCLCFCEYGRHFLDADYYSFVRVPANDDLSLHEFILYAEQCFLFDLDPDYSHNHDFPVQWYREEMGVIL